MSAIRVDDDLIHYEVLGRGRPVILLHSWIGSWRYWIPTMQKLQLKYRVYAVDLYGYGDSGKNPQKYTLEHQVQLLVDFAEHLGITKTALIGHGLGAMVAVEFARRYKDRVPRMLIVNAPLFDPGDLDQRAQLMPHIMAPGSSLRNRSGGPDATVMSMSEAMRIALAEAARSRSSGNEPAQKPSVAPPAANGDNPLKPIVVDNAPEDLLAKCFKRSEPEFETLQPAVAKADPKAMKFSAATFDSGQILDNLRTLPMPIVVVHGVNDMLIPLPDEQVWRYLTTDKGDLLLPVPMAGVRHFPMMEHERFLQLVSDFLDAPDVSKLEIKERWMRRSH